MVINDAWMLVLFYFFTIVNRPPCALFYYSHELVLIAKLCAFFYLIEKSCSESVFFSSGKGLFVFLVLVVVLTGVDF